ncbi:potassium channel subfamily K member 18 [Neopelma chrysocephalum]|uniref:potassium channel subfamily K member 18 n=1 Tax=Neopelma chrysocephalum TaxID=114329 RepID=UPI000FCD3FD3|nr:potassium channel subfamily K member 18 [Neopelma chrysocephalum]
MLGRGSRSRSRPAGFEPPLAAPHRYSGPTRPPPAPADPLFPLRIPGISPANLKVDNGHWNQPGPRAVFPHACFILSLVIYAFLGALMFSHIEGNRKVEFSEDYRNFLQNLTYLSRSLSDNMTENEVKFKKKIHDLLNTAQQDWFVNPKDKWSFFGSLFFCCTVFTTVGYGNTYPVTRIGKYVCMLYALFGIPLMFLVLTDMGDILATVLSKSYNEFRKLQSKILASKLCSGSTCNKRNELKSRAQSKIVINEPVTIMELLKSQAGVKRGPVKYRNVELFEMLIARENEQMKPARNKSIERWSSCPELATGKTVSRVIENFDKIGKELEKLDVPIVLMVLVIFVYISCAAAILPKWESNLDFQEAFYFCFITLTTIGFGDTQLEHPKFFLFFSLYIIIGMEIVFIAFKLGQDRLIVLYKKVISFCAEKKMPSKKIYPK